MATLIFQKAIATKPSGWIKSQMQNDLVKGFVGNLDKLVPTLFFDDIYGSNRRGKKLLDIDLGLAKEETLDSIGLQWWNSETQSQWYDGLIRHSYLLDDKNFIETCTNYVEKMLSYQDEDGYLGIYNKDSRFNFESESGELWAQATLFRALLSYYDATLEEKVLLAVTKAVDVIIANYNNNRINIFDFEQTHGLMLSDILDRLFLITNDEKYINYADWLYKQLCSSTFNIGVDVKEQNILNPNYKLVCHGVHTYEHLRTLVTLAFNIPNKHYEDLFYKYLEKIKKCISPSGGPIGDEWIGGHFADASMTGYEYCSIQELMHCYIFLLQKTGDLKWADEIEHIIFNAAQGARHSEESSIAYLKSDNSYSMNGGFQYAREDCVHEAQIRYKYSPTHQDAAVCCVPNAGRIMPYYLQSTWFETNEGLLKTNYCPSNFSTKINEITINITEKSNYPFDGKMIFEIITSSEIDFEIAFRIPNWCKHYSTNFEKNRTIKNNQIVFKKTWSNKTIIEIDFKFEFNIHEDLLKDYYFTYGPLVLALPIQSNQRIGKDYNLNNLRETYINPVGEIPLSLKLSKSSFNTLKKVEIDKNSNNLDWNSLKFEIDFVDENNSFAKVTKILVPIGATLLRKVTFSMQSASAK